MKKLFKTIICIAIIAATVVPMASCALFNRSNLEYYWVETFDEAMEIIDALKSYGNEIPRRVISCYENEVVDAKYLFIVDKTDTPKQKKGEEWYQRKFGAIKDIAYYGFLDKVSLEDASTYDYNIMLSTRALPLDFVAPEQVKCVCKSTLESDMEAEYNCYFTRGDDGSFLVAAVYRRMESHLVSLPESFHDDFARSLVYLVDTKKSENAGDLSA